jgi:hypothetical protein
VVVDHAFAEVVFRQVGPAPHLRAVGRQEQHADHHPIAIM